MKKILIVSSIPVVKSNVSFYTLDLWCKDLEVNRKYAGAIGVICPFVDDVNFSKNKLCDDIKVFDREQLSLTEFGELIKGYDVVQFTGGRCFHQSLKEILFFIMAKAYGIKTVFSISSNRVKLTLINAQDLGVFSRIKALLISKNISITQRVLSYFSTGTLLVGDALQKELKLGGDIHVGRASWIKQSEIKEKGNLESRLMECMNKIDLRLCVAARLERMKGIHIAIEALKILSSRYKLHVTLSIYGEGAERQNLELIAAELGVDKFVSFKGVVAYGGPFSEVISSHDFILLTNLSDEQPRLVFDAINGGAVPVCPKKSQYRDLGLPEEVLFSSGEAESLAGTIANLRKVESKHEVFNSLYSALENHTIDKMHEKRADWLCRL